MKRVDLDGKEGIHLVTVKRIIDLANNEKA